MIEDHIPAGCTNVEEFIDFYLPKDAVRREQISFMLKTGMSVGVAILSNRIAKEAAQAPLEEQLRTISDVIAKFATELIVALEKEAHDGPVGTA